MLLQSQWFARVTVEKCYKIERTHESRTRREQHASGTEKAKGIAAKRRGDGRRLERRVTLGSSRGGAPAGDRRRGSCRVEEKHAELPLAAIQLKATKITGLLGSCLAIIFMRSNCDSSCNILIDAMSRTKVILHSPENIFSS